jgi:hypothetical protein
MIAEGSGGGPEPSAITGCAAPGRQGMGRGQGAYRMVGRAWANVLR